MPKILNNELSILKEQYLSHYLNLYKVSNIADSSILLLHAHNKYSSHIDRLFVLNSKKHTHRVLIFIKSYARSTDPVPKQPLDLRCEFLDLLEWNSEHLILCRSVHSFHHEHADDFSNLIAVHNQYCGTGYRHRKSFGHTQTCLRLHHDKRCQ